MKKSIKHKIILVLFLVSLTMIITACGYNFDELYRMNKYEKQAEKNAVNYIEKKYGFTAKVLSVKSSTKGSNDYIDITPATTGDVYIVMEYDGMEFVVFISGKSKNTDGIDNYQLFELQNCLESRLENITGIEITEIFLNYGESYYEDRIKYNGMVKAYFNEDDIEGFLTAAYEENNEFDIIVSSINQDIEGIDVELLKKSTGIESFLFVDYDSYEHYKSIEQPYYNITGSPIESGIEKNLVYINSYRVINVVDDDYINTKNNVIEDIFFITKTPENIVTIKETNMNMEGFGDKTQIFESYNIESDSEYIYVFVPAEKLDTKDIENAVIVEQYVKDGTVKYNSLHCKTTDDKKYIGAKISFKVVSDVKFTVMLNNK